MGVRPVPSAPPPMSDRIDGVDYPREAPIGCPLCGASHPPRLIDTRFGVQAAVAECARCRLAYQSPRPSVAASMAYMNRRWATEGGYVTNAAPKLRSARRKLERLAALRPGRHSLLDFGAGSGAFVQVARDDGLDAVGVERSETAMARARQDFGLTLLPELPQQRFDLITLWDVVEHLREPVALLGALRERLTERGVLVLETGNWENWQRLAAGDAWGLYLFDHHFYFTPASLQSVCASAGFTRFRLLDANRRSPSLGRTLRSPAWGLRAWRAWRQARARWPAHGDINVMIAVVEP